MESRIQPIGVDTHEELFDAMLAFVKLTLLFYSGAPWTHEKSKEWTGLQEPILSLSTARGDAHRRAGIHDVTTKRLCDLGRIVLG